MCIARSGDNSDTRSAAFEPAGEGEDEASGRLYVTDMAAGAVMQIQEGEEAVEGTQDDNVFVNEYEGNALNGPHTIRFGPDGSMFFTDAGPFGDSTIQEPRGSVYCVGVDHSGAQVLKPIVSSCLASPAGLAFLPMAMPFTSADAEESSQLFSINWCVAVQRTINSAAEWALLPLRSDGTLYVTVSTRNCADKSVVSVLSSEGELSETLCFQGLRSGKLLPRPAFSLCHRKISEGCLQAEI